MVRLILVWLFCLVCVVANDTAAEARIHGGAGSGGVSPSCPQVGDNGCAASPGGNFQIANYFTGYAAQVGSAYTTRPSYNVPGVDYAVGMPLTTSGGTCGQDLMQDPATATTGGNDNPGCGILPQHCSYSVTVLSSQLSVPVVNCNSWGTNALTFKGFNLAPVGGHGATYTNYGTSGTGAVTDEYNHRLADPSTYVQNGFVNAGGSTYAMNLIADDFYGNYETGGYINWHTDSGHATGSLVGTTMTISSCSSGCVFKVGQYVGITGVNNAAIVAQLTGTGGATCPDPTCNGTTGTYQLNQSGSAGSGGITSVFQNFGNNLLTAGAITEKYNVMTQINGRPQTGVYYRGGGPTFTAGNILIEYNYFGGFMYIEVAHAELLETILQDGSYPTTFPLVNYTGNVCFNPSNVASAGMTSCIFLATGNVAAPIAGNFQVTFTSAIADNNVVSANAGFFGAPILMAFGGPTFNTALEFKNNYLAKSDPNASYYTLCAGAPQVGGAINSAYYPSFFQGSTNGSTAVLSVSLWQGGNIIAANQHSLDLQPAGGPPHVYIVAQLTGTGGATCPDATCTGKEGTYSLNAIPTAGGTINRKAQIDTISSPTISGNVDLISGSSIDASMVSYQPDLNNQYCLAPSY